MRLALLVLAAGLPGWAAEVVPSSGAQARTLSCGPYPKVELTLFTWRDVDGVVTLQRQSGEADGELKATIPKRGKPPPGCPHGLPLPSADWKLEPGETWTRDAAGQWTDGKGRRAKVSCVEKKVRAVENATVLASNPASDGCAGERQLILTGGPRVETKVVQCKLVAASGTFTLTFGAELVASDNDCGGGWDWRVTRP